jgi:hypothetical protein
VSRNAGYQRGRSFPSNRVVAAQREGHAVVPQNVIVGGLDDRDGFLEILWVARDAADGLIV